MLLERAPNVDAIAADGKAAVCTKKTNRSFTHERCKIQRLNCEAETGYMSVKVLSCGRCKQLHFSVSDEGRSLDRVSSTIVDNVHFLRKHRYER